MRARVSDVVVTVLQEGGFISQFILMVVVIFCDGAFSNIHEARIEALTLRIQEETIILSVFIVAGFSRKERIGKETTTIRIFTTTNQSWEF